MTIEFGDPRLPLRFWAKVKRSTNGCWHWTGNIYVRTGYGGFSVGSRSGESDRRQTVLAHRWAFHVLVRPLIPKGQPGHLQIDHECHNRSKSCRGGPSCLHRRCVNPSHLSPRTPVENTQASSLTAASKNRAKTHCKRGHPLSGANLRVDSRGRRNCYTCKLQKGNEARRRRHVKERGEGWVKPQYRRAWTHCPNGHAYSEDNTRWQQTANGKWTRRCRECQHASSRRYADAKRTGELPPGPRSEWTHCKHGHPLSGDNVRVDPKSGKRACRTCAREYARKRKERMAA